MTINLFHDPSCNYWSWHPVNLFYGQDTYVTLNSSTVSTPDAHFFSFNISRDVRKGEQLDISTWGQDSGQAQTWGCGTFLKNYQGATAGVCYDIENEAGAGCVRLWQW